MSSSNRIQVIEHVVKKYFFVVCFLPAAFALRADAQKSISLDARKNIPSEDRSGISDQYRTADIENEAKLKAYLTARYSSFIKNIIATDKEMIITGDIVNSDIAAGNVQPATRYYLAEIRPFEDIAEMSDFSRLTPLPSQPGAFKARLQRVVPSARATYDRVLSKWAIVQKVGNKCNLLSYARYTDSITPVFNWPDLVLRSKKGLAGFTAGNKAPISDLDSLGIASVTVNIWITRLIRSAPAATTTAFTYNGRDYYVDTKALTALDKTLRITAQKNVAVAAIILVDKAKHCPDPKIGSIFQHPDLDTSGIYSMANITSAESLEYYAAIIDFLAHRYSIPGKPYGHIDEWIIHNEVNAGWVWTNMGRKPALTFMDEYHKSMRMVYYLARKYNAHARVFISLTHYWAWVSDPHFYHANELLNILLNYSKKEGDFNWAIAMHPYPESLFEPKTWLDKKADLSFQTPMITFKNIEVLNAWVEQPYAKYLGRYVRPIWLSEQGLNSRDYSEKSLLEQAAGMAYAWKKIEGLRNIKGFQYHNWMDSRREGGLRIGLRRFPDDSASPGGIKPIWDVYKAAGTSQEDSAFEFARSIIGIGEWKEMAGAVRDDTRRSGAPEKPNILFIECDQFRYDCQGVTNPIVKTPNLDRLAAEGMFFTNAFTPIPTCCPARQTFLSGQWPEQHKGLWNYDITLPVSLFDAHTWTEEMPKNGYTQYYFGKWHVHPAKTPLDFGFTKYVPDEQYTTWRKAQGLPPVVPAIKGFIWMGGMDPAPLEKTHTHWLAQQAIAQLQKFKDSGKPWHLRLEFVEPHLPSTPTESFLNMYNEADIKPWGNFPDAMAGKPYIQRQQLYNWGIEKYSWKEWAVYMRHYYAMISQTDDAIGRVLAALKEMGLEKNTVVIFTSDHGDAAGSHGLLDKHYVMYDEEVHVPLVIKWPGVVKPGSRSDQIVLNGLDLSATIPRMAGFRFMQGDGYSLLPVLEGRDPVNGRKYAFSNYNGQQFGLYVERMIRNEHWKYIWNLTDVDELYDLEKDPWEMKNLISDASCKQVLRDLRHALYEDLSRRKDPIVNWGGKTQLLEGKKMIR